ncbi:hypothetical protein LXA43DRAFT_1182653 [Ganoderma leucocontextum]|nr:hypothetical protein LXA43DRAFT_1182653 [Ganoderma leucocontextum]
MSANARKLEYPDPVVFRGKLQGVEPALREEFKAVESHCTKKSMPLSVAVEQLCVVNVDADRNTFPGLGVFYPIPEDSKHRLLSSHSYNSVLHYRWLCFSSPSKPIPVLGLEGDIWVNTTEGDPHIYYEAFKFSGLLLGKYSKALKHSANDGKALGVLGKLPIYELHAETERGDLRIFASAIKDIETNSDRAWTTKELTELIRISRNCRLQAPRVKNFAKRELTKLWAPDLANLTPEPLPGVFEALLAIRWSRLPESLNRRAKYELLRDRDTRKKLVAYEATTAPQEWVISDRQLTQLFRARDYLQDAYREFVAAPPPMLHGPCPENTSAKRAARAGNGNGNGAQARDKNAGKCTATRRRYRTKWPEAVAAKLLSDEYRHDPLCALDQIGAWAALGMCAACAEGVRAHCEAQKEEWWERLEEWFEPEDGCEEDDWIEPSHCGDNPEYDSDASVADDAESEDEVEVEEEEDSDVEMVDTAPAPSGFGARMPAAPPPTQRLGPSPHHQAASGRAVNAAIAQRASNHKIAGLPNKPSWVQSSGKKQSGGKKKKGRKGGRA